MVFGPEFCSPCVRLGDGVKSGQEEKDTYDVSVGTFSSDMSDKGVVVGFRAVFLCRGERVVLVVAGVEL